MSDQSQGPGWWLASDGKWYPPDQAPAVPPPETWATPPAGPPPAAGMSTGAKVAIALAGGFVVLVVLSILAVALLGEETEKRFERTGEAIGRDPTDPAPADIPDGYTLVEGDGVSIAAPESWMEVSAEDFTLSPEEMREAFPDAPDAYIEQASSFFEQGAVLVAFERDAAAPDNISIGEFPGTASFSTYQQSVKAEAEALGGRILDTSTVELPAGEASRVEYEAKVVGFDGEPVVFSGVQFHVPVEDRTYLITITMGQGDPDLADTMARTFRVG